MTYVDTLVSDRLFRRRMGLAVRRRVADRSWQGVNNALDGHYRDVVAQRFVRGLLAA